MNILHLSLALFILTLTNSHVLAEGGKTFTLKDGSTVQGKLVGVNGGSYVIESPSLGKVEVSEADVLQVSSAGAAAIPTTSAPLDLDKAKQSLMSNPQIMAQVQELAADPEIQALAQDPEIMAAAMSGNMEAIKSNPKAQALFQNPKIQAVSAQAAAAQKQ